MVHTPVSYTHLDVYKRQALDNSEINDAEIVVNYTDINGENRVVSIVGDDELGKKLNRIIETGASGNQFTITATYKNKKENYTFNIIRKLSLKNLSVKSTDNNIDLQPQFDQMCIRDSMPLWQRCVFHLLTKYVNRQLSDQGKVRKEYEAKKLIRF